MKIYPEIKRLQINRDNVMNFNSLFCLLFGWGGKTGINCFLLITGYYMCKSEININKILKLILEVEFYKILFYIIFLIFGYSNFSIKELIKVVLPIYGIGTGFVASYLVFYLFIPYLNILNEAMDEKQHLRLIGISLFVGSVLQTLLKAPKAFTYVGWFMVIYVIASYIRLYPKKIFDNKKIWFGLTVITLLLSWLSVIIGAGVYSKTNKILYYHFVSDSNKILAVITAISVFLLFKNLKVKYSPYINKIASSTFGVLMIHASSDTMRNLLWRDIFNNVNSFYNEWLVVHAICSVLIVYFVGTILDFIRIKFIEQPLFVKFEHYKCKKLNK